MLLFQGASSSNVTSFVAVITTHSGVEFPWLCNLELILSGLGIFVLKYLGFALQSLGLGVLRVQG